jgi:hypothetical protein
MGFTKYQRTESSTPISKEGHKAIETELRKVGKSSMRDLDEEERKRVAKTLDPRA